MFNRGANGQRTVGIKLACLSIIGIVMAATTALALAPQSQQLPPVSTEQTPQAAIDEAFAILRAHSIDITHTDRLQTDSCGNFHSSFLNPKCVKIHKRKVARVRRVATYVAGALNPSE